MVVQGGRGGAHLRRPEASSSQCNWQSATTKGSTKETQRAKKGGAGCKQR